MISPPDTAITTVALLIRAKWSPETFRKLIDTALPFVDEICVAVDAGADPGIEGYRAASTVRYYYRDAKFDAASQRNFLDTKTAMQWRFHMDADENLPMYLWSNLRAILDASDGDSFQIARRNRIIDGDAVTDWYQWPDYHVRAYVWSEQIHWDGFIHEGVNGCEKVRVLPALDRYAIQHYKTRWMQDRSEAYRTEATEHHNKLEAARALVQGAAMSTA